MPYKSSRRNWVRRAGRTFLQNVAGGGVVMVVVQAFFEQGWEVAVGIGLATVFGSAASAIHNALENKTEARRNAPLEED